MRIVVACFPKSGSSYLSRVIANLPDFSFAVYVPGFHRREQELCDATISQRSGANQCAQIHLKWSLPTQKLIEKYAITTIVLVRNIFDTMVSLTEHTQNVDPSYPMAHFDDRIAALPFAERMDAIIDLALPWYINFYVSWWKSASSSIVTYEDIVLGGHERQAKYFNSLGIPCTHADVVRACFKVDIEKPMWNVGKAGRGITMVDADQHARIRRLVRHYPEVDFSPIGLQGFNQSVEQRPQPMRLIRSVKSDSL